MNFTPLQYHLKKYQLSTPPTVYHATISPNNTKVDCCALSCFYYGYSSVKRVEYEAPIFVDFHRSSPTIVHGLILGMRFKWKPLPVTLVYKYHWLSRSRSITAPQASYCNSKNWHDVNIDFCDGSVATWIVLRRGQWQYSACIERRINMWRSCYPSFVLPAAVLCEQQGAKSDSESVVMVIEIFSTLRFFCLKISWRSTTHVE